MREDGVSHEAIARSLQISVETSHGHEASYRRDHGLLDPHAEGVDILCRPAGPEPSGGEASPTDTSSQGLPLSPFGEAGRPLGASFPVEQRDHFHPGVTVGAFAAAPADGATAAVPAAISSSADHGPQPNAKEQPSVQQSPPTQPTANPARAQYDEAREKYSQVCVKRDAVVQSLYEGLWDLRDKLADYHKLGHEIQSKILPEMNSYGIAVGIAPAHASQGLPRVHSDGYPSSKSIRQFIDEALERAGAANGDLDYNFDINPLPAKYLPSNMRAMRLPWPNGKQPENESRSF
ncbi:MAG TPA: hypothetical protein VGO93_14340 [Candidatus Xenobia bacterium]